jgi:hypothetical protein
MDDQRIIGFTDPTDNETVGGLAAFGLLLAAAFKADNRQCLNSWRDYDAGRAKEADGQDAPSLSHRYAKTVNHDVSIRANTRESALVAPQRRKLQDHDSRERTGKPRAANLWRAWEASPAPEPFLK